RDARFWDRAARKYARAPIADAAGYERTLARTRALLGAADRVVEIGCGTGSTALRIAPGVGRIVGSDVSSEMIAIARAKAAAQAVSNAEFLISAADQVPGADHSFDAAVAFNVLHLIADRRGALRRMHRLLRPGGLLISKTPCLTEMSRLIRLAVPAMRLIGKAPFVAYFTA